MGITYILGICRTPVGSFGGAFKKVRAVELGATAIREALHRAQVQPTQVDEVLMGNVLQAGQGQNPARQAAMVAGIPLEVPATTINKMCGSGLYSLTLACRTIAAGDAHCVVAGGMESMSTAPHLVSEMRWGARMGNVQFVDGMIKDGLWDVFNNYHMGVTAENLAEKYGISREAQDAFALTSQQKAAQAQAQGLFAEEIVPVEVPQRKGPAAVVERDEYIRPDTTAVTLAKLRPAFKKDGTVTAGNASGINDGAAAMIVASEEFVNANGLSPMLAIKATGSQGVDPAIMGIGPVPSIRLAMKKAQLSLADIGLFELNEAFAAQSLAVLQELELDPAKVNIKGGAIALGHPIGASGARILATLAYGMKHNGIKLGVVSLCIGGGMGEAVVVELCK